jgi:hypothetical protein
LGANAQSPVSLGKKVSTMPAAFQKPTAQTNVYDDGKSTSIPWIVFSDRDENYTYTAPGGSLVMKKLKFMEPFYVSETRNGFIKLIKYEPGSVQGRKLTNKKAAQSYGWISRDKVLLWQSAYVNPQSGYPEKALTIVSGKGPLVTPDAYFDKTDSLYIYTSPEMEHKKGKLALHQLLYVYKKSPDGKTVLVGSDGQLVADSAARSVYGWVPAEAVHSWGDRLYIGTVNNKNYDADDSVAAVINQSLHYNGTGTLRFALDPFADYDQPLLRSMPVSVSRATSNIMQVGVATDVYDRTQNSILNIKGGQLSYTDYLAIRKNIHKINVVFVVDGGSSMRSYFSGLINTIQSFENVFNLYDKGNRLNYGAVVYRSRSNCNAGGVAQQPFDVDYRRMIGFFNQQASITNDCSRAAASQPVFEGIRSALGMFKNHRNETNLVVLIGSTGNPTSGEVPELSQQIAAADARVLAIQVFSDYNSIYNDFVIQSRKLVSESAALLAENKKKRLVVGEGLANTQQFNISLSDSVSFYLDYPKNSLIQGAVIFPPKGIVKSNKAMEIGLKRLMFETQTDIKTQVRSLDSVFRLTGREHRYVTPVVMSQFEAPVPETLGNDLPHNAFKYYLTADVPTTLVSEHPTQLQYFIILSQAEYKQLSDILSLMIGENLQQDNGSYRGKLVKNYVNIVRKYLGDDDISSSTIKDMSLSDYIRKATGLIVPPAKPLGKYRVSDLDDSGNMPQVQFEAYINYLIKCRNTIKQRAMVQQHFTSNGKVYYYVTQANWNN